MKQIITSVCCLGSLAFALPVLAERHDNAVSQPAAVRTHSAAHNQTSTSFEPMRAGGNVAGTRFRSQNNLSTNRAAIHNAETLRGERVTSGNHVARHNNSVTVNRSNRINRTTNVNRTKEINRTTNVDRARNRKVAVTNNWRSERFSGSQYRAFRNYRRAYHDRGWWRSHYHNIVFVSGGWYYWDDGYWFPAWGYAPGAYYPYDGPIYGYNQLAPDRVIVDVQEQLQRDGYYSGSVDGVLGPMTRQAIAAFQADHGLAITSAIDEPTLSTMGLT
jgi:hypothetical protein